jgi:hypothetical protein
MLFALALLWTLRVALAVFNGGALLLSGAGGFGALLLVWAGVSFITVTILSLLRWPRGAASGAILLWSAGYMLLWLIGNSMGSGLSLPVFLAAWLGGSAIAALVWSPSRKAATPARRARPAAPARVVGSAGGATTRLAQPAVRQPIMRRSEYGRIPAETLALMLGQVRGVREEVMRALPAEAPSGVRDWTVRAVLDRTLQDWWENGNTEALPSQDIADLQSFVALASAFAGDWSDTGAPAIYRATLSALLDDWLRAWNTDGVDGPPRRG